MEQVPQQQRAAGSGTNRSFAQFFNVISWGWGVFAVILGGVSIAGAPVLGALVALLGIALVPPVRRIIGQITGVKLAVWIEIANGVAILVLMFMMAGRAIEEAELQKKHRLKLAEEADRRDRAFIAVHPFVDRDSLRAWREHAADSVSNPDHTLASFLRGQEAAHARYVADSIASAKQAYADSIEHARTWRTDSIAAVRRHRADSLDAIREARRAEAEQDRLLRQTQRTTPSESYGGHTIYTGPRGGRYYINSNGNKTYVR